MRQLFIKLFTDVIFPERSRRATLLLVAMVGLSIGHLTYAQNSHILTWRANTYAPPGYLGRSLPTKGSTLTLNLVTLNPSESFSNVFFAWYLDDVKLFEGMDKPTLQTTVRQKPGIYTAKVFLRYPDGSPETITAPVKVVAPEVFFVESTSFLKGGEIKTSPKTLNLHALPFFFNVTSLLELGFAWKIGDTISNESPEKPDNATITIPSNAPAYSQNIVSALVQNLRNAREQAAQSLTITTL